MTTVAVSGAAEGPNVAVSVAPSVLPSGVEAAGGEVFETIEKDAAGIAHRPVP